MIARKDVGPLGGTNTPLKGKEQDLLCNVLFAH